MNFMTLISERRLEKLNWQFLCDPNGAHTHETTSHVDCYLVFLTLSGFRFVEYHSLIGVVNVSILLLGIDSEVCAGGIS
jgi:hypothetical protein